MTLHTTHVPDAMLTDRLARIALADTATATANPAVAALVARYGAVEARDRIVEDRAVHADLAARLATTRTDPARLLDDAARDGIRFVIPSDDEWPTGMAALNGVTRGDQGGAPLGLWVRGPARLDEVAESAVAVVGSRSSTTYGANVAADIAADLARAGRVVVAGGAFGIDQAAHRGAMSAHPSATVAVLACGVDVAYPAAHRGLFDYIAADGALISEHAPAATPTRARFLARNRIIAALSTGTVVVEAAIRSGALNAAGWTTQIGRPVFGVPGPVTSAASRGVHQLLATGAARLVESGADVLERLHRPTG